MRTFFFLDCIFVSSVVLLTWMSIMSPLNETDPLNFNLSLTSLKYSKCLLEYVRLEIFIYDSSTYLVFE